MSAARFKLPSAKYRTLLEEIEERDNYCCVICGHPNPTGHHIENRSSGGGDYAENLICLCIFPNNCHQKVEQGKIKIPKSELERIGYYNNDQRRITP